ncbi:hypothetical protein BT63DRAFT_420407 [Microthyrium microscopicum]|uniref:Homeobox domain-containing protein n=1 Tax=Microthyrium microscopicum TaxID=703497 RepID=A0A6A6UTT8_9PEZI|nr:hypothetical protein BT63DRAFT_420407 [Microthyrium microscopicum]
MDEFLDFGAAGYTDNNLVMPGDLEMFDLPVSGPLGSEQLAVTTEGLTPAIIINDFGISQEAADPETLDYGNFAKWIPRYELPEKACEYCRSRGLECWYTYENQTGCSACCALFRPCSFTVENHLPVLMDTLHVVHEDTVQDSGELTGAIALRCWDRSAMDHPQLKEDDRPSRRSTGTRFSKEAIKTLKGWIDAHSDNPYPSEEEKEELGTRTGLSASQVSNWFANTRRRNKRKSIRGVSPSIRSPVWPTSTGGSEAIAIPEHKRGVYNGKTWDIMDPLERWKVSPPENEPAAIPAIVHAVANSRIDSAGSSLSRSHSRNNLVESSGSGSLLHRVPSVSSLETKYRCPSISSHGTGKSDSRHSSGSHSNRSLGSSRSHGSRNSLLSYGSGHRKDRRRRKRVIASSNRKEQAEARPFQCTFCTDTFRTKFDWTRHEKSLHLNLEKWICAPLGDVINNPKTGLRTCTYCEQENPSKEHLETHSHDTCESKGMSARTFYRKDHLRQHLRLVHGCELIKSMETWKSEPNYIKSRCGFCNEKFTSWKVRCDHIAKHYKEGARMKDWKGCRGLDTEVANLVTNAMPPFLIGNESNSLNPFSAVNNFSMAMGLEHQPISMCAVAGPTTEDQAMDTLFDWNAAAQMEFDNSGFAFNSNEGHNYLLTDTTALDINGNLSQRSPKVSTCWEILTLRLGAYVKEQLQLGIFPNDSMLQRQARLILYEEDDAWHQTAADNTEWLELFKKAHGLPSTTTDIRVDLNEDLGVQDLGLQIGDLSFDALTFGDTSWDMTSGMQTTLG